MAVIITKNSELRVGRVLSDTAEFLIDTPEEIGSVPTDYAPGSIAYTVDFEHIWHLSSAHEWISITGAGSNAE